MSDDFAWLQEWYADQCNGDWEHLYGVKIDTIDNPGWSVEIDLAETDVESMAEQKIETRRSDSDWFTSEIHDHKFIGYGGALNLGEIVGAFRALHSRYVRP